MNCQICGKELTEDQVHEINLWKEKYFICGWDALRIKQYIEGNTHHLVINIFWGAGHIAWSCWDSLRKVLRENNITEVLELGIGLSSELFIAEGMKLIGFDVWPEHVKLYQEHLGLKERGIFYHYPEGTIPPIKELYPRRKWDFIFIDGPQERSREVRIAMELSNKFIFLHDPKLGEESFFPNDEWIEPVKEGKLYVRRT